MSMHGSAMMYVTSGSFYRGQEMFDQLNRPLDERRGLDDLVEAGRPRAPRACGRGVTREPDDRDVGIEICDLVRVDAADIRDHEIGWVDPFARDECVAGAERLELRAKARVDADERDPRHACARL